MPSLKKGDKGNSVRLWQRQIARIGYDLSPYGDDGDFGSLTEHRTFQALGRLEAEEGAMPWKLPVGLEKVTFLKAKYYHSANRTRIPVVVMHTGEILESATSAEALGRFFQNPTRRKDGKIVPVSVSVHASYDSNSIVESVMAQNVAWAAPGANRYGYQCEISGRARQSPAEWADLFSRSTLSNAAWHLGRHVVRYKVPIRLLDEEEFAAFAKDPLTHPGGFTEHRIASAVWREYKKWDLPKPKRFSTHWDPGNHFPWESFLQEVSDRACSIREANA